MSPVSTANGTGSASGGAITPPHNLDAEQSVLGAILLSDRSLYALVIEEGLRAEDFYRERHGAIYAAMLARGFTGEMRTYTTFRMTPRDWFLFAASVAFCVGLLVADQLWLR